MNSPENEPITKIEAQLKQLLFTPADAEYHKRLEVEIQGQVRRPQMARRSGSSLSDRPLLLRLAWAGILALLAAGILLLTPPGQSLAAQLFRFFIPAGTDQLPPLPPPAEWSTGEAQPTAVSPYTLTIEQATQLAGRDLLVPSWLPEGLAFAGGSYDPQTEAATLAYGFSQYDVRLSFIQGLAAPGSGVCDLCDKVGESAYIQTVQIGDTNGEYVEGVWKLTDKGAAWEPDPYLKTLRWQVGGVIYQIVMMGEEFGQAEMIRFAEGLR